MLHTKTSKSEVSALINRAGELLAESDRSALELREIAFKLKRLRKQSKGLR